MRGDEPDDQGDELISRRLALSYNSLRDDSIVPSFAKLSRLRYLNLKGNDFSHFPSAVSCNSATVMRSVLTAQAYRDGGAGNPRSLEEPDCFLSRTTWASS